MSEKEPTVREWILQGLVGSCISSHTLYGWYLEMTQGAGYDSVGTAEFHRVLIEARDDKLVYVERAVTCYEHSDYRHQAAGWSLTEEGYEKERILNG